MADMFDFKTDESAPAPAAAGYGNLTLKRGLVETATAGNGFTMFTTEGVPLRAEVTAADASGSAAAIEMVKLAHEGFETAGSADHFDLVAPDEDPVTAVAGFDGKLLTAADLQDEQAAAPATGGRIPVHTPEWGDPGGGDPGHTAETSDSTGTFPATDYDFF